MAFEVKNGGSSPIHGIFLYVAPAVEHVLAVAFGKKLCWFESHYRHISVCSPAGNNVLSVALGMKLCGFESHYRHISLCRPGSWTHAISSLWNKNGGSSPINSIFLYVAPAVEHVFAVAFRKNYVGSSPTIGIFLYVAPAVEHVLSVAFGKNCVGSSPTTGIFLYVAPTVEHVLSVAFRKKLCWFESH